MLDTLKIAPPEILKASERCVMTKVTMQALADAVGVSRITVWKALTGRAGVSSEVREEIQRKAVEIGYMPASAAPAAARERAFSVVVSRPESSIFWMQIIHHIAKELAHHRINLLYTYMPTSYKEGYTLPASLSPDNVDGFLVLNVNDERLLRLLAAQPVPKIFLDSVPTLPPSALNGDLVLLEGRTPVREITARLLESGRTRLGFVGDVNYAQTNYDRHLGFLDAHRAAGLAPDERLSLTEPLGLHSHYEQISRFLDGLDRLPDGFVCASDFIASFISRYLQETGRRTPDSFVLTGFDDSTEYPLVAGRITTVSVETAPLGKRLARMLIFRADYPASPYEVAYITTTPVYRGPLAR